MTNLKRGLIYFTLLIIYSSILYAGVNVEDYYSQLSGRTANPFHTIYALQIFPIIFGITLAVPKLILAIRTPGLWKIDWVKIISIGLPALIISLQPILYFSGFPLPIGRLLATRAGLYQFFYTFGVAFGYILISSFYKDPEQEKF